MNSIWSETCELPHFPTLDGDIRTDVLIIGGGIAGILCAHQLQQAGVDYILVEAGRIGNGVTKNTTAKITSQHGLIYHKLLRHFGAEKTRLYLDANEAALQEYRKLCSKIDCDFTQQSSYVYALNDRSLLELELEALQKIHYPAELALDLPLPFHTAGAVKFQKQAQFHPLEFLSAIVQGLCIYENTAVQGLAKGTAVTKHGTIHAEKIIVATHFPMLNKHGSYFLKLYQHRSYVIALENGPCLDGMFVDQADQGMSFRSHRNLLLIGGGDHRTGKQGGNWRELEVFAQTNYPGANIQYRWATQDCMSLDGVPYIGLYSARTPNLFVATGFNKWGMTSSMAAAQILTDLVQEKTNPYAAVFSPSRSMLRPQLALNSFETITNLLTPTAPRCPHMGCALKWNPQEHSWDCPCHGSRFEADGKLIDNPATGDLKMKKKNERGDYRF